MTVERLRPALAAKALTLEAWIKPAGNHQLNVGFSSAISIGIDGATVTGTLDERAVPALGAMSSVTGAVATDGAWHHVAMSWDGKTQRLYVDGSVVSDRPCLDGCATPTVDVGVSFTGVGTVDEIQLWSVARSADDVRADLARQPRIDEPGLYSYFSFDGPDTYAPLDDTGRNAPLAVDEVDAMFRTDDAALR
jgi:hypothetical protein